MIENVFFYWQDDYACVTQPGLPLSEENDCDYTCLDGWPCGKLYDTLPNSFASADLYKLGMYHAYI